MRGRGIGDHRQRRLERVGEIARMAPRFLRLGLVVGEQLVDFLGQRPDLGREVVADARLLARPDRGDLAAHAAQRPKAVEGLQRRQDEQADAERSEAPDQSRAKLVDLLVDRFARLRDLEAPAHLRPRQDDVALGDPQRFAARRAEFVAVVEVRPSMSMWSAMTRSRRSQSERDGKVLGARAADLEIEPGIGLDETLVGGRPVEAHLAVRADLGRGDHRCQQHTRAGCRNCRRSTAMSTRSSAKPPMQQAGPRSTAAAMHDHAPAQRAGAPPLRSCQRPCRRRTARRPPPRREPRGLRRSSPRFLEAVAEAADGGDHVRRRASCGCA